MSGSTSDAYPLLATSGVEQSTSPSPLRQRRKRRHSPSHTLGVTSAAARALGIYEIAEMAILHLHQPRTSSLYRAAVAHLASTSRVCRVWNTISTPILYSELEINVDERDFWLNRNIAARSLHLAKLLAEDVSKARLVRRLCIEGLQESALKRLLPNCSALVELLISLRSSDKQTHRNTVPLVTSAEEAQRSITSL